MQTAPLRLQLSEQLSCLFLIHCSSQQPKQQTEESPTAKPDPVYADIVPSQEPELGTKELNTNSPANNDRKVNDPVVY